MLASALGRYIGDSALHDLQQRLLNALAAYVTGDGGVLAAAGDLVYLIDVYDSTLRSLNVVISSLDKSEQYVLNVLADVACLGKRRSVRNGERHIQQLRQGLCQHGLTNAGRSEKKYVTLLKFHLVVGILIIKECTLVVVVNGHAEDLLSLLLSDDVLVKILLDILRLHQLAAVRNELGIPGCRCRLPHSSGLDVAAFDQHVVRSKNTLVAYNGILAVSSVKNAPYLVLILSAKGANHHNYVFLSKTTKRPESRRSPALT